MLSQDEIRKALHAGRVVPLSVNNPHGPFGLEQLAATVQGLRESNLSGSNQIQRPITLPLETWTKLDSIARQMEQQQSRRVTASEVATALVIRSIDAANDCD